MLVKIVHTAVVFDQEFNGTPSNHDLGKDMPHLDISFSLSCSFPGVGECIVVVMSLRLGCRR